MKYQVNPNNEIARKYTIKEIFVENWRKFVKEMGREGKPIRETIMREVERIMGCQDSRNGFRVICLSTMLPNQICTLYVQK